MNNKMETADGIREVLASTIYGHGEAKCRYCGEVVEYNVSYPNVSVKPVKTHTKLRGREVEAFEFSMPCPKDQKEINLGKFRMRKGIGFDKVDSGDLVSGGNYLSSIAEDYRSNDVVKLFIDKYRKKEEEDK